MDRVIITLGDFLKNAGIVGMKYLLDISEAEEDSDYGITPDEQGIWLDRDFALQADWTDLYFNACVKYFGKNTVYQGVLDRIERCLTKIREDKEYKDLINRLNRIEGQVRGVKKMIENDAYCTDVLIQVSAITAALNSFNKILLSNHISTCVADNIKAGNMEVVDELVTTIQKLMK